MNCEFCQSLVHVWFQCPKKPDGWKPARLATKSTERKNKPVANGDAPAAPLGLEDRASSAKQAVDTTGVVAQRIERHEPDEGREDVGSTPASSAKFDKKAWMREYMREYMRKRRASK